MMPVNNRPGQQAQNHKLGAAAIGQAVDQHIHPHVNAGAHTVGGAKLGHPHKHDDAQLLRPTHVDAQQPVLHALEWRSRT
jgi:hypothetical protein